MENSANVVFLVHRRVDSLVESPLDYFGWALKLGFGKSFDILLILRAILSIGI